MKRIVFALVMMALTATGMAQTLEEKVSDAVDRSHLDFHWGFNNWGDNSFNGLAGVTDSAYSLRTSFSSYQLSFSYDFVHTGRFALGVGLGYESDVYKFNEPYVFLENYGLHTTTISNPELYSTKLCARYVTLPIGVTFFAKNPKVSVRLSLIPGLNYTNKHTGLKFVGYGGTEVDPMTGVMNPFKMDVRIDLLFHGNGIFFQVATMPLMNAGDNNGNKFERELYPIKIGFTL